MRDDEIAGIIKESIDLHFHIGPDILPRKYNVEDLIREEAGKIRGVALKSHSFPTIALINAAEGKDGITLVGSITLNYFMGGFNESAIYASSMMSHENPIIVWMPTVHAENHLIKNKSQYEIPPEWVKDPDFKPRPKAELKAIKVTDWAGKLIRKAESCMKVIQDNGCIVATGHVSWQEASKLAEECIARGVKVIVTHPMQRDIAMPLEEQVRLARMGAYIEYCYIMYLDRDFPEDYPLPEQARAIREIGPDRVVLTSDAGQKRNPGSTESLRAYVKLLEGEGIGKRDFERMLVDNPKAILGI
jgi:hypothetical protein